MNSFSRLGWKTESVQICVDKDILLHKPDILITDEYNLIAEHKELRTEMSVVAVTNERGENIAYEFGADFVVVRPVDFADPLGMNG